MLQDFEKRLAQACDESPNIPPYGHGRQVYIANKLKVSQEAVRKWFTGESRPKVQKMRQLATLLEQDEAWLSLGIKPEMDRREKRAHGRRSDGAVYMLFGLFSMAGGACAFPSEEDPRSDYIDFYAILNGVQFPIHAAVGRETSKNVYEFVVPREYGQVRSVGVVPLTNTRFHLIDLQKALVDRHRQKKAGAFAIHLNRIGSDYMTGADKWPRLESLGDIS
jgi:transcriptional regulator with XRE-family HTH domain